MGNDASSIAEATRNAGSAFIGLVSSGQSRRKRGAIRAIRKRPASNVMNASLDLPLLGLRFIFTLAPCEFWLPAARVSSVRISRKSCWSRATTFRFSTTSTIFTIRKSSMQISQRLRVKSPIHQIDLRDSRSGRTAFSSREIRRDRASRGSRGGSAFDSASQLYYDTNVSGTLHLLEAARTIGVERFIFASSSSVYGISKTVPFSEELHLTQTISPYAATKIAGEFLCSTYSHLYRMRVVALRFFTVYGPRQRPDLAIHQFTRRIHAGQPIDQFGDGTTRRDYTYIDDIIQGVMASLHYEGPLFDIFNLGENETIQLKDLITAIEAAVGRKAKINQLPEQAGRCAVDLRRYFESKKAPGLQSDDFIERGLAQIRRMVATVKRERLSRSSNNGIAFELRIRSARNACKRAQFTAIVIHNVGNSLR